MSVKWKSKRLLIPATFIMALLQGCYICAYQLLLLNMAEDLYLGSARIGILAGVMFGAQIGVPLVFGRVCVAICFAAAVHYEVRRRQAPIRRRMETACVAEQEI